MSLLFIESNINNSVSAVFISDQNYLGQMSTSQVTFHAHWLRDVSVARDCAVIFVFFCVFFSAGEKSLMISSVIWTSALSKGGLVTLARQREERNSSGYRFISASHTQRLHNVTAQY